MVKYIIPIVEENGVLKPKYSFDRKNVNKVHYDIPNGVVIVEAKKEIKELEDKEDVKKEA